MAMFSYFPGNYVWNLSVDIALESGARIGEITEICEALRDAAAAGSDAGTPRFAAAWVAVADRLADLAAADQAAGRAFSAGAKLRRAALYYLTAERMQAHGASLRAAIYAKGLESFTRAMIAGREPCVPVTIPFADRTLAGLFTAAAAPTGPSPCVLYVNGLDSCKELLYFSGLPQALARRGIATLCLDQPGTGAALRLDGIPATHEAERWATPAYDYLAARPDLDPARIGMVGISLGGYFTPRAMAMEPRFASGAVWGANHDWAEVQQKRLQREGENPVPHYWAHVQWVFGATDLPDFLVRARFMCLDGILDRIRVPFLVTHGARDRQIGLEYAQRTFDQLTASPRRELKIFTDREGGVEHVGVDNMSFGCDYIADWFAETLGGHTA